MVNEFGERDERQISRIDNSAFGLNRTNAPPMMRASPHGMMIPQQQQQMLPPRCTPGIQGPPIPMGMHYLF
jgi:hypothetical protein